jgi:threonylcarbamoyladenosine tRNA methylthiotransferase MtaB
MVKVTLDSLGCKLNQAETELLTRKLAQAGYELVPSGTKADIYILNTCTVTHIADRKSRHLLRRAHRQNPEALVVATGCYAERAPEELKQVEGVNLVLGNGDKSRLPQLLIETALVGKPTHGQGGLTSRGEDARTRSFVKVQDGCSLACAYCVVPLVRGRELSLPAEEVLGEVRERVVRGYREVVLTGVRIGAYGGNGVGLKDLLERILEETGVERLRLSSLQPQEISRQLLGLFRDGRLCPHFHLCLQSGSGSVLRRMKRGYSISDYEETVSLIRANVPEVAITTDVMVGFPGETEAEFKESLDFCCRMEFARIHVFAYSRRAETLAARLPNQVGDRVRKERSQRMLELAGESAHKFQQRFLGRTVPVLFEQRSRGVWSGLTANYIKVYTRSSEDLANRLVPVELVALDKDGVWGEVNIT